MSYSVMHNAINILLLIAATVLLAVGVIDTLNKLNARLLFRLVGNYVTFIIIGIGTMFHELSHALFCLVFHHKIIEVNLLSYDSHSKSLGYVNHQWDKTNFYQSAGNFFIGLAPLFSGLAVYFLGNELFGSLGEAVSNTDYSAGLNTSTDSYWHMISSILYAVYQGMIQLFALDNFKNIWFYPYVLFSITIAYAVAPSFSDLRSALPGSIALAVLVVLANIIMYAFNMDAAFLHSLIWSYTLIALNAMGMLISCSTGLIVILAIICIIKKYMSNKNKQEGVNQSTT